MLLNYHTFPETKQLTKDCKLVQLMVSPYRKPSPYTATQFLKNWGIKQDVIIHYDYYRTTTRYAFMNSEYRTSFMHELATFRQAEGKYGPNVKGMVVHADSLFSYEAYKAISQYFHQDTNLEALKQAFAKSFTSKMLKPFDELWKIFTGFLKKSSGPLEFVHLCESWSRQALIDNLRLMAPQGAPLLIENTTRNLRGASTAGFDQQGLQVGLSQLCYDTEHAYASGDNDSIRSMELPESLGLVHFNPTPKNVKYGSYLDRHSETDLSQGVHSLPECLEFLQYLTDNRIPYIREVKPETLKREIELFKSY